MKLIKQILSIVLIFGLTGCKHKEKVEYFKSSFSGPFDTVTQYITYATSKEEFDQQMALIKEEFTRLDHLFDKFHSHQGINNIKTINDNAGIQPVKVASEIIDLIEQSIQDYHHISKKVNIAMGSVLNLWQESKDKVLDKVGVPPTLAQLKEANKYTQIDDILIDKDQGTVFIQNANTQIDVGATAKGFAVEIVKDKLIKQGVKSFLLSSGGNVAGHGKRLVKSKGNKYLKRSKLEYSLGIETPNSGHYGKNYPAYIIATDLSVVTSGDYQRYFVDQDGNKFHHLIDPDTLYPASYFRSVTIITKDSGYADFLSSALFLTPYDQGKTLIESLEGVEAIWLMNDGKVNYSSGLVEGDNIYIVNNGTIK